MLMREELNCVRLPILLLLKLVSLIYNFFRAVCCRISVLVISLSSIYDFDVCDFVVVFNDVSDVQTSLDRNVSNVVNFFMIIILLIVHVSVL